MTTSNSQSGDPSRPGKAVCINHPDREGKRSCFYCHNPICPECQIHKAHHIFCSPVCFRRFALSSKVDNVIGAIFVQPIWVKLGRRVVHMAAPVAALAFFGWMLLTYAQMRQHIASIERKLATLEAGRSLAGSNALASAKNGELQGFRLQRPVNGGMIMTNTIDFEGTADDNQILSLMAGEELLAVTIAKQGKFSFENVHARRGKNHFRIQAFDGEGRSVLLEEVMFSYAGPSFAFLERNLSRGPLKNPRVAITFDGGGENNVTGEILDILKAYNVRCTMFLTGRFLKRNQVYVHRMLEDGHEIGNHTWGHPHLTTFAENRKHETLSNVTREFLHRELNNTAEYYKLIAKQEMAPFWRAPYGEHNRTIRRWAAELGYRHIGWTVGRNWMESMDTMDWVTDSTSTAYHTAGEIVDKVLDYGKRKRYGANGCIVLMHLGTNRISDQPHKKLPDIIEGLRAQGYELVKVSELVGLN